MEILGVRGDICAVRVDAIVTVGSAQQVVLVACSERTAGVSEQVLAA